MKKDDDNLKVRQATKMIADQVSIAMVETLKKFDSDDRFFQAQVCDLLSSFIFGITIKTLKDYKVSKSLIDKICKDNTETAFYIAENGKYKFQEDH